MVPILRAAIIAAIAIFLAACVPIPPDPAPREDLVREARWFMDAYAADIRAGNREAIADRYDRRGAYFLGNGTKELASFDAIRNDYLTGWKPPADFEWFDLSYEPVRHLPEVPCRPRAA
jgi:hypothetical protein